TYNNDVALAAIEALRAQDDVAAVPAVLDRLKAAPLDFRTRDFGAALDALAFLAREQKDRDAPRQFIAGFLNSPKEELRAAAARSLGTLRDPKAIALLQPLIAETKPFNDPVRTAAEKSLADLSSLLAGPQDLKSVWDKMQTLQRKTDDLQKELEALRKKGSPEEKTR
ncbi:MAG: HEAT repeat domain-containing protein, partial [Chthoniobacteraceae bacterium]